MEAPGVHPEPPSDIRSRSPLAREEQRDWFRIYPIENDPLHFGRTRDNRFDSFSGRYGVLYLGADAHCAFIETYGYHTGVNTITVEELGRRGLARISVRRPVKLVDLVSGGSLARIGADARLIAGEHAIAQRWSDELFDHPAEFDGVLYPARHDPTREACALFDRVSDQVLVEELGALSDRRNAARLGDILDTYRFGLIRN